MATLLRTDGAGTIPTRLTPARSTPARFERFPIVPKLRHCLLATLALLTLPASAATEDQANPWTLNLYFENDLFDETDQNLVKGAFFDGYSHAELAASSGLPLGTVKSRVRRALLALRSFLEKP